MELGAFSISLAVKDIAASRTFYEALGFSVFGGVQEQNWLIMKNGSALVGLFQGMFEGNMLTFNPGWDSEASVLPDFTDVRQIQARLKSRGIALSQETDPEGQGTGHISLADPDGNAILIDQHVSAGPAAG
jgi:lactoylglutathione lyase